MMTCIYTIDSVLPTGPKMLPHVIPAMERTQGLLGTIEAIFDSQTLPVNRVFTIIELFNVVHSGTVSKFNHIVSIYA
jgi:hypothetical protein